jgi:hypothetical protein
MIAKFSSAGDRHCWLQRIPACKASLFLVVIAFWFFTGGSRVNAAAQQSVMTAKAGTSRMDDRKTGESNTCTPKSGLSTVAIDTTNTGSTLENEAENSSRNESGENLTLQAPAQQEYWMKDEIRPRQKAGFGEKSANEIAVASDASEQKCTRNAERPKSTPKGVY